MTRRRSLALLALLFGLFSGCGRTVEPAEHSARDPEFARAYGSHEEAKAAANALAEAPPPLPPQVCQPAEIVRHGSRARMRIALTFDACSTHANQFDDRVARTLEALHAPATIFLGGEWTLHNAAHVKWLASNPLFELGNHTFTHPHMTRIGSDARVLDEFLRTQRAVYDLTGRVPRYFRPPYGEVDGRVSTLAAQAGLTTIEFDLASGDPDKHATRKRLVDWVLRKARPGGIVVMHMNHLKFHTAEALPEIISGLRRRGFELVTVGELLRDRSDPVCRAPEPEDLGIERARVAVRRASFNAGAHAARGTTHPGTPL